MVIAGNFRNRERLLPKANSTTASSATVFGGATKMGYRRWEHTMASRQSLGSSVQGLEGTHDGSLWQSFNMRSVASAGLRCPQGALQPSL